uniref:Transposase n=1 Tax=Candidatus Kentrum sp. LPFa TaxID=2126335 RepID=A0A450W451_9GAMM|nr:MAG: Transposase [Candidatus Kentron sp. LPFa]
MIQYPEERKNAVIRKMLAPQNTPVLELSRLEGISKWTLYTWRKQAIGENHPASKSSRASGGLSAETKFAIVVETATLSEEELGRYCRERGLFGEKIKSWKQSFIQGVASSSEQSKLEKTDLQKERKRNKELEQELHRKEKALAETAALLVLRKKPMRSGGPSRTTDQCPGSRKSRNTDQ